MHVKKRSQNVDTKTVFTLNVDYDRLNCNPVHHTQFYTIMVLFTPAKIQI